MAVEKEVQKPPLMKYLILCFPFLLSAPTFAQDCTCSAQFDFVQSYCERNNPAFQKISIDPETLLEYRAQVQKLRKKTLKEKSSDRCNLYLEQYIDLLRDNHSGIGFQLQRLDIDFSSAAALDSFKSSEAYRSFRKINIDTTRLLATLPSKAPTAIEGIYTNGGSLYIGVIADGKGKYVGVALRPNRFLEVGHVLLELNSKAEQTFASIYHVGLMGYNFRQIYQDVEIKDGAIQALGLYKVGYVKPKTQAPFAFESLDAQTNYLRLSSFDGSLKSALDSLYTAIAPQLKSKPYLIIDLRGNGGGDERCYFPLMPYLYTRPLRVDSVEVWVSPDNITRYEAAGAEGHRTLLARMKAAKPNSFIPQVENAVHTWTLDSVFASPLKIALLFDRKTASSAEGMITYALQSDKVITVGENSGGFLGYGDVMETPIPCGKFVLRCTTTKYSHNSKYEFIGIEPMYKPAKGQDWVAFARYLLQG